SSARGILCRGFPSEAGRAARVRLRSNLLGLRAFLPHRDYHELDQLTEGLFDGCAVLSAVVVGDNFLMLASVVHTRRVPRQHTGQHLLDDDANIPDYCSLALHLGRSIAVPEKD